MSWHSTYKGDLSECYYIKTLLVTYACKTVNEIDKVSE